MTTKVRIQNLSEPNEFNHHVVGVRKNGATVIVLKPGEDREMYVWGTETIEIVELPAKT